MSEFASPAGPSPAPRKRRVARKTMVHQQQQQQQQLPSSPPTAASTGGAGFDDGLSPVNNLPPINLPTDPFVNDSQQGETAEKKGPEAKKVAAPKSSSKSTTTTTTKTTKKKKSSPEVDVVGLAENLATHSGEKPDEKPPPKKKAKEGASTKPATTSGGASATQVPAELCSEGVPTETLPDGFKWSEGWVRKVYKRMGGKTAGTKDSYWISPTTNLKLRSIPEVVRFMKALGVCNGDETEARKRWKEPQFAPPPAPKKTKTSTTTKTTTAKANTAIAPKKGENPKKGGDSDGGDTKPPPTTQD
mmetsp:Transcript_41133/g.98514  ORF Transcript_41133/g.98514 Transcript_41133/m.98514 type:complete len:303 (+) Transcript_41133:112-1020(+)